MRVSRRRNRPAGALGAALVLAALAAALAAPARGDATHDAIRLQLASPAISGDGKTVALVSLDPGDGKGATGSLVVIDAGGALKRRLPLWAPGRGGTQAQQSYADAMRLLDEGGYRRMGRLKRQSEKVGRHRQAADPPPRFEALFSLGDYGVNVTVAGDTLRVEARRGKRTLGPWTVPLATPSAACPRVGGYAVSSGRSGLEAASRLLALSVVIEDPAGSACFSREAVFALK
jgi:hypothetical protein